MDWVNLISSICGAILSIAGVGALVISWRKNQQKESKFMMKMLFEIIDIMDGKKINGQVKRLRKEAEQFNIDN